MNVLTRAGMRGAWHAYRRHHAEAEKYDACGNHLYGLAASTSGMMQVADPQDTAQPRPADLVTGNSFIMVFAWP